MITVYVLVTFYDDAGIHYAGTICKVKAENFDPRFMKKVKSPSEYVYSKTEVDEMLLKKQDSLTEGSGIDIDEDEVISCTVDPTSVSVTQVQSTGTKIATITVDDVDTDLYAPNGGGSMDTTIIADDFDTEGTVTPPAGTLYNAGDVVKRSSNYYSCKNNNTQSGTWTASKWTQLTVTTVSAPGANINQGDYALDSTNNKLYKNNNQWTSSWFSPGSPSADFVEVTYTPYDTTPYSAGGTVYHQYNVGDYVIYEDVLYRCTGSTTGESWVPAKWSETQVMDEIPAPGSTVSVTQVQSTGTKIATITVDGNGTDIYAPSSGGGSSSYVFTTTANILSGNVPNITIRDDLDNSADPSDIYTAFTSGHSVLIDTNDIAAEIIFAETQHGTFLVCAHDVNGGPTFRRLAFLYNANDGVWNINVLNA